MKITELKTNYQTDPLGIDLEKLTFTWRVGQAEGSGQKAGRLQISAQKNFENTVFDSGETVLPLTGYTPDLKDIVKPGVKYYWKVELTDETGDHGVSEAAAFEGGIPDAFAGQWIAPAYSREIQPVMRKTFSLTREELEGLASARLYVCGLGLYEAYLNGEKIGEDHFAPYFTDYRYWVQYQTYDITALLHEGENTLDVWLGDGWYKGRFGYLGAGRLREYYGDQLKMIADLYLNQKDGRRRIIATDESFRCLMSPVVSDGIYDGEVYDARRVEVLRNPSERDISPVKITEAPAGKLTAMVGLPVKQHEKLSVKEIICTPKGETILDFGQEITGWVEFTAHAEREAHIVLSYSEVMQDGNFYNDNLRTATATYEYVSDGTDQRARAHFTFYGFRYVKVEGMRVDESNAAQFTAVALYSDLAETGNIETGNAKVNQLISNTRWSQKDNFLDIPTDCPQRDERLGWTGDAEIFSGTACYHMETPAFFRKFMRDMKFEQDEKGGAVPYVVPDVLTVGREKMAQPPFDMSVDLWGEAGASVWGDAAVIIPWNLYLHYGNKELLAEQYAGMKAWTDYILHMDETYCGGKRLWTCGFHFGDWLALDVEGDTTGMDNREGGTDKHFVASVFYMNAAALTAKAARILENEADALRYDKLSREVRKSVVEKYVTGEGEIAIHSQTAYSLAICFGLFDTEQGVQIAGEKLAQLLAQWNDHLATGFVGTAYLCHALTRSGQISKAYKLLLNEDYPSWLYEVNLGATTTWERWNSILPDGHISGTGMNSLNHYAYGCIAQWIYESVCGVCVSEEAPGGSSLVLTPHADARLGKACAKVRLAAGTYECGWEIAGDTITYTFEVPFGCSVKFIPDRVLSACTVNGVSTEVSALDRTFTKGRYTIKAKF